MATNIRFRRLLLAFLILAGIAPFLRAQSAGYFIDTKSGEPRFFQRLVWIGGEYALRYEVVVEREVDGTFITQLQEFTETPFIEVSLPPGRYRFHVISYDLLDRPEETSQWVNMEVRSAVQPELIDIFLEFVSGGTDASSGYVLNITGNNLDPGAEFFIRRSDGTQIIPTVLDSGEDGNAKIFIDSGALEPGEYEIVIRNPGGLEAVISEIVFLQPEEVEMLKPIYLFAGVAWTPVFPVHGHFFGESFSPLGFGARFSAAFSVPIGIHIGAELTAFWHVNNLNTDNDDFENMVLAGVNLLAMKWLPNQITALNFRLGLSYIILPVPPVPQDNLMLNIGASFLWRFTDYLLEIGFDYAGRLSENSFDGFIRPWIGAGMIF